MSVAFAQEIVREVDAPARPPVGHASLRPIDEGEEAAVPAPALPPDLPPDLPPALGAEGFELPPEDGVATRPPGPGERDPFRPFTLDLQPKTVAEDEFLTPLQRYDLQQLIVAGVMLDIEPPRAMLQDDAGMGYIVTPGTLIGRQHGVVTDVQPRRIIVEETYVDFYGREQVRQAIMEMPAEDTASPKPAKK
jgi:hypothetical protein